MCAEVRAMVERLQNNAEKKSKLPSGQENFTFYQSEIMIGNNTILVSAGSSKVAYISHHTFNVMTTTNPSFLAEDEAWLNNLMKRSVLISGVSEKQRNQFFRVFHNKLDDLEASIT
jgi:hypothetical protein